MTKTLLILIIVATSTIILGSIGFQRRPAVFGTKTTFLATEIVGLIIPHHDLARKNISSSVEKVAQTRPDIKYIAVLSPNHFRPQSQTFTTSRILKNFPIAVDKIDLILSKVPDVKTDEVLLENEHGLYIPMTYLAHYFPEAKFIPIAVSPYFTNEKLKAMAASIISSLPPASLVVASVDFSHNHMLNEALENDKQTIEAIQSFDYKTISEFDDNNVDSPAALSTVMYAVGLRDATTWETWQESHGAIISGNPQLNGTSYVTGVFRKNLQAD